MGNGRELDWDDEVDSQILRTVASASPFSGAWDIAEGGLDFDDVGETEIGTPLEDLASPDPSLPIGTLVAGRYVVEGKLGEGAMGVVYDAAHISTGKRVALKYLDPSAASVPMAVKRFFRETQIAALVKHPNVVELYDGGRFGHSYFLAMERLEGRTLAETIEDDTLAIAPVIQLFLGIADGVAAVHERGVIHRDLKADNVFLTTGPGLGQPKVLDFGVSKLKQPGGDAQKLTMSGQMMGTPHYMAPEQFADSRSVDARADVYSIGVMLYEALAREVPYDGDNVLAIYRMASEGDRRPLHELRPDLPRQLAQVVKRAMQPAADDRYASVLEMREALAAVAAEGEAGLWVSAATGLKSDHPTMPAPSPDVMPQAPSAPTPSAPLPAPVAVAAPEASRRGLVIGLAVGVGLGLALGAVAVVYALLD